MSEISPSKLTPHTSPEHILGRAIVKGNLITLLATASLATRPDDCQMRKGQRGGYVRVGVRFLSLILREGTNCIVVREGRPRILRSNF
ncbi:hypothetical protein Trydic_g18657 [Trypoxylus dichotomus]